MKTLGLFLFSLGWLFSLRQVHAQTTIDTLSFFLADNENLELIDEAGTTPLTQKTAGNAKLVVKWRLPQSYEYYTWDNEFIYLRYDSTCCGSNPPGANVPDSYSFNEVAGKGGRWLKRSMQVGESLTVSKPQGLTLVPARLYGFFDA